MFNKKLKKQISDLLKENEEYKLNQTQATIDELNQKIVYLTETSKRYESFYYDRMEMIERQFYESTQSWKQAYWELKEKYNQLQDKSDLKVQKLKLDKKLIKSEHCGFKSGVLFSKGNNNVGTN